MFLPILAGRAAFVFYEENFDVDQIVGPENVGEQNLDRLAEIAMQRFDPDFAKTVRRGDVLIANHNFGYGHPHYPPMLAMRHLGISAVIAESFAPGYWREEMEEGFPQITCPGIINAVNRWDEVVIDFAENSVRNRTTLVSLQFDPFTASETRLLTAGGLNQYIRLRMQAKPDIRLGKS